MEVLGRILAQRGVDLAGAREGHLAEQLLIPEGRINVAKPATWASRLVGPAETALVTVAPDGTAAKRFPVQCNKFGGTRILAAPHGSTANSAAGSCDFAGAGASLAPTSWRSVTAP